MPKDWNGVCPNCSGSGLELVSRYGRRVSCFACDGTGDITGFLYKLMAGEIVRDGLGWIPNYEAWDRALRIP